MRISLAAILVLLTPQSQSLSCCAAEDNALLMTFKSHCVGCHGNADNAEGGVSLTAFKTASELGTKPHLLEKLVRVLSNREMPPTEADPLPDNVRLRTTTHLRTMLRKLQKSLPFETIPIRRLNRFQYNNAVVDLLELDRDVFQLNERLLRRRDDYFRPATRKMPAQVHVSSRPLSKDIDNQRPEGFRGVAAFPQDKRAEHGFDNRADHLTLSPLLMESFLKLSQTIAESPDLNSQECRSWDSFFSPPGMPARGPVEGRYEAEEGGPIKVVGTPKGRVWSQKMENYGPHWSGNTHLIWMCREKGLELELAFDVKEAGRGLRIGFTKAPDYGRFQLALDGKPLGKPIDLYDPKVVRAKDKDVAVKELSVGPHRLMIQCIDKNDRSSSFLFAVDYLEVTGRKSREAPSESIDANEEIRNRLVKLLRRAFRRPAEPETLDRFTMFAQQQLEAGSSFEDTMRTIVAAVLGMPDFLYLTEFSEGEVAKGRLKIDDFELATRLSQFFWSSIPDDALLDLAEAGRLTDPKVLNQQIDRMLNDRRSSRFCDNFPGQWLQLDRLITSIPDPKKYSYFYYHGYRTSMHMMSEPLLLFETVYVEDRSALELIAPKFTWQSDMLRQNYEGQSRSGHSVQVQLFQRVPVTDPRRGGVITNAAVMTMTSTPTRTQPITRGAWINEVIFNDPPKPPPADVPPLPEVEKAELEKLTIRERLAVHRKRADCAGCHNRIDPLGFALENYGPTGVWRDKYENGRDVDVSGVLFNQHEFKTVEEFKSLILKDKSRFLRAFSSHLLSYALGRKLGPADSPALEEITASAAQGNDSLRSILKNIALSEPFLHKR